MTLIEKIINFCDNYLLFNDVDFFKRGKTILSKYPLIQKRADIKFDLGEIEIEANSEEEARKIAIQMDENGELYDLAGGEECEGCDFDIESVEEDE